MSAKNEITLTYLNIRQSIAILLSKLIVVDLLMAFLVIFSYFIFVTGGNIVGYNPSNTYMFLAVFVILGILKIISSSYIVLLWLNEYYEITPEYVIHKNGIIFKKTQQYRLDHVRAMDVEDSFLGELLNFGTITLFDIRLNKYLDLYLIHNPRRYAKIFKQLRPRLEVVEGSVWLPGKDIRSEMVAEHENGSSKAPRSLDHV